MPRSIDSILLAAGPSDRDHVDTLLDEALAVAAPTGATVHLLHVFPRNEYEDLLEQMQIESAGGTIPPDELAARHDSISTPAARLEESDVDYEILGVIGDPDSEIVRMANDLDVDRIVIGGASRSPAGKAVFGDHAQQVLLNGSCPVMYVQRD
ncbi:universal stress protein [Halalkalicoccus sp. NIPERK01]|uniref:universal stress protein n=1 Tax=Halalkalicoccus sp. NIPERK01 TaxID=3053469 RepID=UPI00256F66D1|nr:universal stress protein [Halalkalicoccus sp. NIPERK01]MDL5363255.1 universal stress protein [Halalkalicoccus sp. NIPERK01]